MDYSFDDEAVIKFCYHINHKILKIHFDGYSKPSTGQRYLNKPCALTIKNWKSAKGQLDNEDTFVEMNNIIGIFSMILFIKNNDGFLEMYINTIDNKYINLVLENPTIIFEEI